MQFGNTDQSKMLGSGGQYGDMQKSFRTAFTHEQYCQYTGFGNGQLDLVLEHEIPQFLNCFKKMQQDYEHLVAM
jgi:hypothetical protein